MTQRCHAAPGCGPSPAPAARLAAIACAFVATIPVSTARAQGAPGSLPASRRGEVFDLRLSAGGAGAEYRQHSYAMAHLDAVSVSASLRWGGFIDPHFCFGYELLVGQHIDVGTPTIYPPYVGELRPAPHESYTVVSPIGAFIELYPIDQQGLYLGASASVGLLSLPEFAHEDGALMAGYGGELGYDTSGSGKQGLGFFSALLALVGPGDIFRARRISSLPTRYRSEPAGRFRWPAEARAVARGFRDLGSLRLSAAFRRARRARAASGENERPGAENHDREPIRSC